MSVGLSISTIRAALADQLKRNLEGQYTVDAWPSGQPASSNRITVMYPPGDVIDFWVTFGGAGLSTLRLELVVEPAGSDVKAASKKLDELLSVGTGHGNSVIDAVLEDRTLGLGAGIDVIVSSASVDEDLIARVAVTVNVSKQGAQV